jgi:hypothetical protein
MFRLLWSIDVLNIILAKTGNLRMKLRPETRNLEIMPHNAAPTTASPWIERRTRSRFQLVFPVIFHWRDGTAHSAIGYCRNIGLGGIFIVTSNCPPINSEMEIDVVVPAFAPAPSEILFRHTGRAIRIQACEDLVGFAVAGEFEHDTVIPERITASKLRQQ